LVDDEAYMGIELHVGYAQCTALEGRFGRIPYSPPQTREESISVVVGGKRLNALNVPMELGN
jgi:hypothetical protein